MKSQQNNLSSGDYQREAEITRHRLAGNIDELSDRLTPGQVFDEMLTYARAGGGTFFRTLGSATRETRTAMAEPAYPSPAMRPRNLDQSRCIFALSCRVTSRSQRCSCAGGPAGPSSCSA